MPAKKNFKTTKTTKSEKKIVKRAEKKTEKKEKFGLKKGLEKNLKKALILQNNIKLAKEDKMLEKVEEYVDKNREKTSQEILERKSKRPVNKYQEADLEVMISRIWAESKPKEKTKEISKRILYIIYAIVFIAVMIFTVKYFFAWNVPQIS